MNKVKLVITETFQSLNEPERKQNLQKAIDRYLLNALQSDSAFLPEKNETLQPRPIKNENHTLH